MDIQYLIKPSFLYTILKKYTGFAEKIFYSEHCVSGLENIPENSPVIFAPNHQNALMDALVVILNVKKQPVFMARADIFSSPFIKKLLHTFKIIPVFRMKDGVENLSQNDTSFDIALQCLITGNYVGIMPEGNHGEQHRLRPLKKGLPRLAYNAQQKLTSTNSLKIIPVGINLSHYSKFRSKVMVNFGPAIDMNDYMADYEENQPKALTALKDKIAEEMKKLILHIDSDLHYDLIMDIKEITWQTFVDSTNPDYAQRYKAEKIITDKLVSTFNSKPELANEFKPLVSEYNNLKKRLKLADGLFSEEFPKRELVWDIIRKVFVLPVIVTGALFNLIPTFIIKLFLNKVEDPQFISSYKFVASLIVFPLYYLLFICMPIPILAKFICILTMPIAGILAYDYFNELRLFISTIKFRRNLSQNEPSNSRVQYLYSQIVKKVKDL